MRTLLPDVQDDRSFTRRMLLVSMTKGITPGAIRIPALIDPVDEQKSPVMHRGDSACV